MLTLTAELGPFSSSSSLFFFLGSASSLSFLLCVVAADTEEIRKLLIFIFSVGWIKMILWNACVEKAFKIDYEKKLKYVFVKFSRAVIL